MLARLRGATGGLKLSPVPAASAATRCGSGESGLGHHRIVCDVTATDDPRRVIAEALVCANVHAARHASRLTNPPHMHRDARSMSSLHQLAREGKVDEARQLLSTASDDDAARAALLNATDKLQRTPLHLAAWANQPAFMALLLEQRSSSSKGGKPLCDVHAEAMDSTMALHFAAQAGSAEGCTFLLDAGARVDARSGKGSRTALMLAAKKGHAEVVRLLLARGASALLKDSGKQTAADQTTDVAIRGMIEEAYDRQTEELEARRRRNQEARDRAKATTAASVATVDKEKAEDEEAAEPAAAEPAGAAPAPAPADASSGKRPAEEEEGVAAAPGDEGGEQQQEEEEEAPAPPPPSKKKPKVALSFQDDMEDESDLL